MSNQKVEEVRTSKETVKEMQMAANMGILTVDTDGQPRPPREQEDVNWHELTNAFRARKVLSGMLGGIEKLEGGWVVAVIQYKGYRIIIPMEEMMINLEGDGRENASIFKTLTRTISPLENLSLASTIHSQAMSLARTDTSTPKTSRRTALGATAITLASTILPS